MISALSRSQKMQYAVRHTQHLTQEVAARAAGPRQLANSQVTVIPGQGTKMHLMMRSGCAEQSDSLLTTCNQMTIHILKRLVHSSVAMTVQCLDQCIRQNVRQVNTEVKELTGTNW